MTAFTSTIPTVSTKLNNVPTRLNNLAAQASKRAGRVRGPQRQEPGYRPNEKDVLLGRAYNHHIGNKNFRSLISVHMARYLQAPSRQQKSNLVAKIVELVRHTGGSFLKPDDSTGQWWDVGDKMARLKTGHAIRDMISHSRESKSGSDDSNSEDESIEPRKALLVKFKRPKAERRPQQELPSREDASPVKPLPSVATKMLEGKRSRVALAALEKEQSRHTLAAMGSLFPSPKYTSQTQTPLELLFAALEQKNHQARYIVMR